MKVAFSGGGGSGKTTLVTDLQTRLSKEGKQVYATSEIARECPFPLDMGLTKEAAFWIWSEQIRRENRIGQPPDGVTLTDRTAMDALAYMDEHNIQWKWLLPATIAHLKTYDHIFIVEQPQKLFNDGLRHCDNDYQRRITSWLFEAYMRVLDSSKLTWVNAYDTPGMGGRTEPILQQILTMLTPPDSV